MQGRVSRKMRMKVISQMVKILLLHDCGMYNCWRRAREINPAKITPNSVKMLGHLGGANRRGNREPKIEERGRVGGFGGVNRRRCAFFARIESRNRAAKKFQMFKRDI